MPNYKAYVRPEDFIQEIDRLKEKVARLEQGRAAYRQKWLEAVAELVNIGGQREELVQTMEEIKKRLEDSGVDFDGILDITRAALTNSRNSG